MAAPSARRRQDLAMLGVEALLIAAFERNVGRSCRVITAFGNRRSLGVRSLAVRRLV